MSDEKAWLQMPVESDRAFELFHHFLSLAPGERTIQKVADDLSLSRTYVSSLASRHQWRERVRAFTNYREDKEIDAAISALQDVRYDWASWERRKFDEARPIVDRMLELVERRLDSPDIKLSPADIVRFLQAVFTVGGYLAGRGNFMQIGALSLPSPSQPVESMGILEREDYIRELREAQQKLVRGELIDLPGEQ